MTFIRPSLINKLLIALMVIAIPISLQAQEKNKETDLGKVMVVDRESRRDYETGDVDIATTSSFHKIINREDFDDKTENLAQVIKKESGVQVKQSGGLGSYSTVSLRGSSSKQVLVYLDGILLNEASGGGVDLSSISLKDVESIEIFKGSVPVNFSKSSIGGVVNIRTLRKKRNISGSVMAGYGSFSTFKASAWLSHKPGNFDYVVSADWLSSDNDFNFTNDNGTIYNKNDDYDEGRANSQFKQQNYLVKAGYDMTPEIRMDFSTQLYDKSQHLPGPHNSDLVNTTFATKRSVWNLALTANKAEWGINTRGAFDYTWQYEKYDDSDGRVGLGKQKNEYVTNSAGYKQFIELPLPHNIIILNGDFHYEQYEMKDIRNSRTYSPSNRKMLNLALDDSIILFGESLIIKPSLRYMKLTDTIKTFQDPWGNDYAGYSIKASHITPQIGFRYNIDNEFNIKGNTGKYVREPSFYERFGDRGFIIGNKDLKEERGTNLDLGIEFNYKPGTSMIQNIFFSYVFFRSQVDDIITYIYDARGVGRAINVSESEIKGAEVETSITMLKWLTLSANYTYQDCIVTKSKIQYQENKYLPGRFMHSLRGIAKISFSFISIYYEQIYESGLYYDSPNLNDAPDKNEINMGSTVNYGDFSLILEAKNLTNSNYEDFNGFPQPGRAYYATIKYTF